MDTSEAINQLHIPRWHELPNLNLYMDQLIDYLLQHLDFLSLSGQKVLITKTMVNNYVNQGIMEAPENKRYSNQHIAYLIVIFILKQCYSLEEITKLFDYQHHTYATKQAYNFFCDEFENCFKSICNQQVIKHIKSNDDGSLAVHLIRSLVLTVSYKLYVQITVAESL